MSATSASSAPAAGRSARPTAPPTQDDDRRKHPAVVPGEGRDPFSGARDFRTMDRGLRREPNWHAIGNMTRRETYLDWNATAPLRPEAAAAMAAALGCCGNPSSVHRWGRAARQQV